MIFAANATQALNTAIFGLVRAGDRVVTTVMEHNSVLRPLYALERQRGIDLAIVGLDDDGLLDYEQLERVVEGARLVCCTHASNLTGDVVDIEHVARITHAAGALLLVDASQTAGAYPVNMEAVGADVLCFTGHKALMGPTGTGGLIANPRIDIEPLLYDGTGVFSDQKDQPIAWPEYLEAGTLNGHGLAGLTQSVSFIRAQGVDVIHKRLAALRAHFVAGCGAKVGAGQLAKLFEGFEQPHDPNLLVGFDRADDAAVYKVAPDVAMVQTLDFFPPIADDSFTFGAIAATNALSDIYAMGGEPKTALNIMAVPQDMDPGAVREILRGGCAKASEAGAIVCGGHGSEDPEPSAAWRLPAWCIRTAFSPTRAPARATCWYTPSRWASACSRLP